jgi:hypothetical protein
VSAEAAQRQPRASLAAWRSLLYERLSNDILQGRHTKPEIDGESLVVASIAEALQTADHPVPPGAVAAATPTGDPVSIDAPTASAGGIATRRHVIITGSLHLVGGALRQLGCDVV